MSRLFKQGDRIVFGKTLEKKIAEGKFPDKIGFRDKYEKLDFLENRTVNILVLEGCTIERLSDLPSTRVLHMNACKVKEWDYVNNPDPNCALFRFQHMYCYVPDLKWLPQNVHCFNCSDCCMVESLDGLSNVIMRFHSDLNQVVGAWQENFMLSYWGRKLIQSLLDNPPAAIINEEFNPYANNKNIFSGYRTNWEHHFNLRLEDANKGKCKEADKLLRDILNNNFVGQVLSKL